MSVLREKWPAIAGVVAVTALLAWAFRGSLSTPEAPPVAPAVTAAAVPTAQRTIAVKERNGTSRNLAGPSGRIRVVHFWATWCAPCVEEFPGLLATWRQLKSRKDIEFLAVSVDDSWKVVDPWLAKHNASDLPMLLDPTKGAAHAFGTEKFPETWVLGPDGGVLVHVAGPMDWTDPNVARKLEEFAAALPKKG